MKYTVEDLLKVSDIFHEPDVAEFERGREILQNYPNAELHEVPSHWKIPHLHGFEGSSEQWINIKKTILVLGSKKSLSCRPKSRSSHFVAPSMSNGCTMACSYCYVPRRKGFANPITVFVNIKQILRYLERHAGRQGPMNEPSQVDEEYWVYEIGENGDTSVDAAISDNVKDTIDLFKRLPNAKATFATKFVNLNMLNYDPQLKTRIRFSLMPPGVAKIVDVRTSPIEDRIAVLNDFVDAGYELHLNFSPVIYYENWLQEYKLLFEEINDRTSEKTKKQLKCEIIFLTHNDKLHEVNMQWHPKGEKYLWNPEIQETKYSQTGGRNLRYKRNLKSTFVEELTNMVSDLMPYCEIRYAF